MPPLVALTIGGKMSKFVIVKKVGLEFLGDNWKECYLEFNTPSYGEIKEFIPKSKPKVEDAKSEENQEEVVEEGINLLEKLFIGGKGFDGKTVIDITKDDLKELPVEVITKSFEAIVGTPSPNSSGR